MKNKCRSVLKKLKSFWKNADAQDLVEYALLLIDDRSGRGCHPEILQQHNQECFRTGSPRIG